MPRSTARPSTLIARMQQRGEALAIGRLSAVSHRVRRREADVGAGVLRQALPARLQGRDAVRGGARCRCAREWAAIVEELAGEPRVLCHRDYHSRNLMLHDGQLYIIDFQDARMGPDTYDLVSLLRDSYVDLTAQQVEELIAFFLALKGGAGADRRVPPPVRPDGGAAQPQGARHLRLHDDVEEQYGLYSVHPAYAGAREGQPRQVSALRALAGLARSVAL